MVHQRSAPGSLEGCLLVFEHIASTGIARGPFRRATLRSVHMWVDSHCHLQLAGEDPAVLLERAPALDWLVVPGIDAETSRAAMTLAAERPDRILAAAGLHPHDASRWVQEREAIAELAARAVAIGETGLDFYRNLSPREDQISAFRDQLALAADLDKPAIVHCRDAFREVFEVLEASEAGDRTVMHCWTGGPTWTRRFLDLGVMFSFAGPVAFATGDTVRRGAAVVPPGRSMVETDTPYLSPPPFLGEANEPSRVELVGAALARVWGIDPAEVAASTTRTAQRVFRP